MARFASTIPWSVRLRLIAAAVAGFAPTAWGQHDAPGAWMGRYEHACVAADHTLASEAGAEILRAGGNAVDAAVATSFALSVVRPYSCGIGGGGFMVIRLREHPRHGAVTTAINYREVGPSAVRANSFENEPDADASTHGGKAVCVPGTVAGLLLALDRYGTMDRASVLMPAIRLAERGFDADQHYIDSTHDDDLVIPWFREDAARQNRFAPMWNGFLRGGEVRVGDRIHAPQQADALRLIAEHGRDGFYRGPVADAIVRTVNRDGGWVTHEDLAAYTPVEMEPLRTTFRGMTVLTMPPPSSGGIVLAQVFGMLEHHRDTLDELVARGQHNSAAYLHLLAEASKHAFADRARWIGDPAFVPVPTARLLDGAYLKERACAINLTRTFEPDSYGRAAPFPDDHGTSHLCVVDAKGGAVACTETINLIFGSMLVVEPYGFVLNDEMDDFLTREGKANAFALAHAERNRPAPGKRPLSSMTPTIVLDADGDVQFLGGGAGGPRIMSGTIQATLNALVWNMDAGAALGAPRMHHQWQPDRLDLEPGLQSTPTESSLKALGHAIGKRKAIGNVQIVKRGAGGWEAASDPRKGGTPDGY